MKATCLPILSAAALAFACLPAGAQMVVSAKSGVVNYTEGNVLLNGKAYESSLTKYEEIKENGMLSTQDGRAEVLLTPGTILRLSENADLKMITNRLIDTRVELQRGSAVVTTIQTAKDNNVTVVVNNEAVTVAKAGIYRFEAAPATLKVYRGEAMVEINGETTPVSTGRMLLLDGSGTAVQKFNTEDTDALDHWSRQRGQLLAMANPSTAKSLLSGGYGGYGYGYGSGYGYGGVGCNPYWGFNTWYGMYTYVPCSGYFRDPYGFGYWSPYAVSNFYYRPMPNFGGGGGGRSTGYPSMGVTSGGYSSSMGSVATSGNTMGSSVGSTGSTSAAGVSSGGSVGHSGGTAGGGGGGGGSHGH
jgi:hypothetical protein